MPGILVTSNGARWFGFGFGTFGSRPDTRELIERYTKLLVDDHFEKGLYRPAPGSVIGTPIAILEIHLDNVIFENTKITVDISNDESLIEEIATVKRETYTNESKTETRTVEINRTTIEKFTFKSSVIDFVEQTHTDTSVVTVDLKAGAKIGVFEASAGVNIKNSIEDKISSSKKTETTTTSEGTSTLGKSETIPIPPLTVYSFPHYVRTVSGVAPQNASHTFDAEGRVKFVVQTLGVVHQWVPFKLSEIVPDPSKRKVQNNGSFDFEAVTEEMFPREEMTLEEWKNSGGFPGITDKVEVGGG